MKAYGYDFHQTMIAKIEAAQRPLRVRELADFAALYGMEVHELIYPPAGSLREVSREIAILTDQLQVAGNEVQFRRQELDKARAAAAAAEEDLRKHEGEAAMLQGRLAYLETERKSSRNGSQAGDRHPARQPRVVGSGRAERPRLLRGQRHDGHQPDGQLDRRHVERKSKAARNKAVRELERKRDAGRIMKPGRIRTVREMLTRHLDMVLPQLGRAPRPSSATGRDATSDLPAVGRPANRPDAARVYRGWLRGDARRGPVGRDDRKSTRSCRAPTRSRCRRGNVARNPCKLVEPPRLGQAQKNALTLAQARAVLAAVASGGTAPGGLSGWRAGCARGRRSACGGRSSTSPPARCGPGSRFGGCHGAMAARIRACAVGWQSSRARGMPEGGPQVRAASRVHPGRSSGLCAPGCTGHAAQCPQRHGGGLVFREIKERRRKTVALPSALVAVLRAHPGLRARADRRRERLGRSGVSGPRRTGAPSIRADCRTGRTSSPRRASRTPARMPCSTQRPRSGSPRAPRSPSSKSCSPIPISGSPAAMRTCRRPWPRTAPSASAGAFRANRCENCYEGQMSAAQLPAFPQVRDGAAYRNRTDDLFITSASGRRAPAFRTVHLRRQIANSASPGTALRWQELSRQLSRSLHHSPSLRSGPPHALERMRRPFGYPSEATGRNNPR